MHRTRLCLFSMALLCGCGGGNGGGGGNPDGGGASIMTVADFQAALATGNCVANAKCGYIGASEEKTCEADATAALKNFPPAYSPAEAVDAKRLAFDAATAQKCADTLRTLGCTIDEYFALSDLCEGVYKGLVMPGGMCRSDVECAGGWCDMGMVQTDGCAGMCVANTATGAACDPNDSRCGRTDFCDSTAKKCTARAAAGMACGGTKLPRCQLGLFCKGYKAGTMGMPDTPGMCAGPGAVGDACAEGFFGNTNCTPGLFCDSSKTPAACATRLAAGAECDTLSACADGLTCVGLDVDTMTGDVLAKGRCGPFLDVGKMCADPKVYETGCPYSTLCDAMSKLCVAVGTKDSDCGDTGQCNDGLYCDSGTLKCTPQDALGAPCTPPATDNDPDPCHDGSCDETTKKCVLVCM